VAMYLHKDTRGDSGLWCQSVAVRDQLKCVGTRAETRFRRLLAAEVCASAVVILDTPCSEVV